MNLGATRADESMSTENSNWWVSGNSQSNFTGALLEQRNAARAFLVQEGLPTFAKEDWRYTSLSSLKSFQPVQPEIASGSISVRPRSLTGFDSILKIELQNGSVSEASLHSLKSTPGLRIVTLNKSADDLMAKVADAVRFSEASQSFTSALAFANCEDVLCIQISADFSHNMILNIEHQQTVAGVFSASYICVFVEAEAACRIVETFKSAEGAVSVVGSGVHIMLEEKAQCKHVRLLEEGAHTHHFSSTQTDLQSSAKYSLLTCVFGGKLTRNDVRCRLRGADAHVDLLGVNLLRDAQHVDNNTVLDHISANCTSLEVYKGIYADKAKGVFDGTIIVRPDAQKTNAIQSSKALLLSDTANSFSKPQLKIWADDVKCTHGATVGQIDETALFYLRSRGIEESQARSMLAQAFVSEVFTSFSDESLISWVNDVSSEYLAELFQG
jgi:Fe-S cluster assembly protein SufD